MAQFPPISRDYIEQFQKHAAARSSYLERWMDMRRGPRYGSYPRIPGADWPARRETAREFAEGELERLRDFRYYIARLGGRPAEPPDTPLGRHLELPFEDVGLGVPGNIFWGTPDGTPEGKHLRQVMMGRFLTAGWMVARYPTQLAMWQTDGFDSRVVSFSVIDNFAVTGVLPAWDGQSWRRRWLVAFCAGLTEGVGLGSGPVTGDDVADRLRLPDRARAEIDDWVTMTRKEPQELSNFWVLFEGLKYRLKGEQ